MAAPVKLNAFSINKLINLVKGETHGSVGYTLNEAGTEVHLFHGKYSNEYIGTCEPAANHKLNCTINGYAHIVKAGCDTGFSSDPEIVETKETILADVRIPDAGPEPTDSVVDAYLTLADADVVAGDTQVSTDGQVANGDARVVPADANIEIDGAQANADMSVAADVAPLPPDIAPPPPLDLEAITFGIEPDSECLQLPQSPITSCMDIASAQAFDVSRLFTTDAQPVAQVIEDVQLLIDDDDNNPNNANQNYPHDLSFIDRADRQRYIHFVPVDVGPDNGLWNIEVHDESIQHPEESTVEIPGNIRASRERCVNGDCSQYSYTVHIAVNGIIEGALTSCSWQYPKPEGSLCGR